MYKIAIYAICKDEVQFVDRWMQSMSEADYICVLDTGSTDGTYETLLKYQEKMPSKVKIAQKIIHPWRFDIARNESMKLIPKDADICVCTDLDEILIPSWANDFRNAWNDNCNRLVYLYAWSHNDNGEPARVFWYNKCHDNSGQYYWSAPVHETLNDLDNQNTITVSQKIYLHHYPDMYKSRESYLSLLELRTQEEPNDNAGKIYLAHEYFYHRLYERCIEYINQILPIIPPNNDKYMADLHMFLGDSYCALHQYLQAEQEYFLGIQDDASFRDNYVKLGQLYVDLQEYDNAIHILNKGLLYSHREYSWLETDEAWGYKIFDLLSLSYYYFGSKETALSYAQLASIMEPTNQRLKNNYELIKSQIKAQ